MSSKYKRAPKTRSSKRLCTEKFNCQGVDAEAEYECEDCGSDSFQCLSCEKAIHSISNHQYHDRKLILKPSMTELCQNTCRNKNFADVVCDECKLNLCNDCDRQIHNKSKRQHHKIRRFKVQVPPKVEAESSLEDIYTTDPSFKNNQKASLTDESDESMYVTMQPYICHQNSEPVDMSSAIDRSDSSSVGRRSVSSLPDVATLDLELQLAMNEDHYDSINEEKKPSLREESMSGCECFLLADNEEKICVDSEEDFVKKLAAYNPRDTVKVISIFGNTGDGKSHTLNHTFFDGKEVFKTSANQIVGTVGVWAAYDPNTKAIIIDTEGLLGVSKNQNQRTRLLLKVLAISDIVIYRTRADRLHNDLFQFLGDASKAFSKHFTSELRAASKRMNMADVSNLGPAVVIFHETQHTDILCEGPNGTPEEVLKKRFNELELTIDAFSALVYVGTRTRKPPTQFNVLYTRVMNLLENKSIRSRRKPEVVFNALKVLNDKFTGDIEKAVACSFPDQYFTCNLHCTSCNNKCGETMNHVAENIPHSSKTQCIYQHQYENVTYTCKACWDGGKRNVVVPKTSESRDNTWLALTKYVWAGYVLECPKCGVIYRSRKYWYGNEDPVKSVVRTETTHVWPGSNPVIQGTHNAARRLLDGLNYVGESIASVSAGPAESVGKWVADQIAPPYWVPNCEIKNCYHCKADFNNVNKIHHCRACGQGFCDDCTAYKKPVPERGWGNAPVRVCKECFEDQPEEMEGKGEGDGTNLMARKVGEAVGSTFEVVASAMEYPLDVLRDSARPTYWVPDHKIIKCHCCAEVFGPKLSKHHCRSCGQGVCNGCSPARRPVSSRGWDHPVRVCEKCDMKKGDL